MDTGVAERVRVIDPLSTKGLEYDATVVVDPDEITASCAGGVRTLYVVLTRAAHRMVVLRCSCDLVAFRAVCHERVPIGREFSHSAGMRATGALDSPR